MRMINVKKGFLIAGLSILALNAFAAQTINPNVLTFSESQLLPIALSNTDVNRISVMGDKISGLNCVSRACAVSYDPNDTTGSAYVTILTNLSFTMFITTAENRNFSLQVNPESVPGKTYVFQPLSPGVKASSSDKQNSDYETGLVTLISNMMNGQAPDGYWPVVCAQTKGCPGLKTETVWGVLKMEPLELYVDDDREGQIFSIVNTSNEQITVSPNAFYTDSTLSVALSKETLNKGESALLYKVISNPAGAQ